MTAHTVRFLTPTFFHAAAVLCGAAGCFWTGDSSQPRAFGSCDPTPCLTVSVAEVPPLPEHISLAARERIADAVMKVLYAPLDSETEATDRKRLLDELAQKASELPENTDSTWNFERSAVILYSNPKVVTIDVRSRGYMGGAHGFEERRLMSFDAADGSRLRIEELLAPNARSIFETIAEFEFRRVRNVPVGMSLEEAGFTFPAGKPFLIPDNFGVVEEGIVLFYQPYEVAAYALGPTEVLLPKDAVSVALKSDNPQVAHLTFHPTAEAPSA